MTLMVAFAVCTRLIAQPSSGTANGSDSAVLIKANELLLAARPQEARQLVSARLTGMRDRQDTADLSEAYSIIGISYYGAGDYPPAIEAYVQAERFARATGRWISVGRNLNNLGLIHGALGRNDEAMRLYIRAVAAYEQGGDTSAASIPWCNRAILAEEAGYVDEAERSTQRGIACLNDTAWPSYSRSMIWLLTTMSDIRATRGDTLGALAAAERAVGMGARSGQAEASLYANLRLGRLRLSLGELVSALSCLDRAQHIERDRSIALTGKCDLAEFAALVHERVGPPELALREYRTWIALRDSVSRGETRHRLEALTLREQALTDSLAHRTERHRIQLHHERQLTVERSRRMWLFFSLTVVTLTSIALGLRWRASRRTEQRLRALNAAIVRAHEELVVSEKAREVERVRTRIARDLHDEIGGELTKITFMGSEAERQLTSDPVTATALLSRIRRSSREVGRSLSDVVWAVDPANDTAESLIDRMREHSQRMLEASGIAGDVRFEHEGADRPIDPATKRDLYLIMKEALNNTLKHANAARVSVVMRSSVQGYELNVKDDGRGFDPADAPRGGNGTRNMRHRAEALRARFDLRSIAGEGTELSVSGSWR